MSDYTTLKQAIQSVIKTNGNEEITGAVLQSALLSIIDSIGANYTFAGVATPQTDAGSPDQNVFYIGGAGTYTNFGSSFVVNAGELGVFTYNGSWSQNKIIGTPFANIGYYECASGTGSNKSFAADGYVLNTGSCIHVKMTNRTSQTSGKLNINSTGLKDLYFNGALSGNTNSWDAGDILQVFYDGTAYQAYRVHESVPIVQAARGIDIRADHFFGSSLTFTFNGGYDVAIIPLKYQMSKIKLMGVGSTSTLRFWGDIDICDGQAHTPLQSVTTTTVGEFYDIPTGAKFATFNLPKSPSYAVIDYSNIFVEFKMPDFLGAWKNTQITSTQLINFDNIGNYQSISGEWVYNASARCTNPIPCTAGDVISFRKIRTYSPSHSSESLNKGTFIGFFDVNDVFLFSYNVIGTYTDGTNAFINGEFTVPDNIKINHCRVVLKSSLNTNAMNTDAFIYYGSGVQVQDTYSEISIDKFYFPDDLLQMIYEGGSGGGSMKDIKILSIGNSYSEDAFSYVTYILRNIFPNVRCTFGIAAHAGASLQMHVNYFTNDSQDYSYFKYLPDATNAVQPWESKGSKKGSEIIADEEWDMIILQQSSDNQPNWSTYQPYLNQLVDLLQGIVTHSVKMAWMMVQCKDFTATHDTTWQGILTATQNVMEQTVMEYLIPVGTAIENARTTNLNLIGGEGHMNYNGHLQEGIGCQIAAYMATLSIIDIFALGGRGILFDTMRMTQTYLSDKNIPGPHGTSVGVTDYNCYAGQMSAIMASKTPYTVSNMVTLGLVDNSKIVTT